MSGLILNFVENDRGGIAMVVHAIPGGTQKEKEYANLVVSLLPELTQKMAAIRGVQKVTQDRPGQGN